MVLPKRICSLFTGNKQSVEQAFIVINSVWHEGTNRRSTATIKAVLLLKVNVNDTHSVFYDKLIQNTTLLERNPWLQEICLCCCWVRSWQEKHWHKYFLNYLFFCFFYAYFMTLEEVDGECPSFFISKQSCALAIVFQVLSPSFKTNQTKSNSNSSHPQCCVYISESFSLACQANNLCFTSFLRMYLKIQWFGLVCLKGCLFPHAILLQLYSAKALGLEPALLNEFSAGHFSMKSPQRWELHPLFPNSHRAVAFRTWCRKKRELCEGFSLCFPVFRFSSRPVICYRRMEENSCLIVPLICTIQKNPGF